MSPWLRRGFSVLDQSALLRLLLGYFLRPRPKGFFLHPPKITTGRYLVHHPHRRRQASRDLPSPPPPPPPPSLLFPHVLFSFRHVVPAPLDRGGTTPETARESSLAFRNRHHKIANSDLFYHHWRPPVMIMSPMTLVRL